MIRFSFALFLFFVVAIRALATPSDDICISRGYVNLLPERQYCQSVDHALGLDVFVQSYQYGSQSVLVTSPTEESPLAYVKNLYVNLSSSGVNNQVWSQLAYAGGADARYISSWVRLDAEEGAPQQAMVNGAWRPTTCALVHAYAYTSSGSEIIACGCQLSYLLMCDASHGSTCACVPGCSTGTCGSMCTQSTVLGIATPSANVAYTTIDCLNVCRPGCISRWGSCVCPIALDNVLQLSTTSKALLIGILVPVCLFLCLFCVVFGILWTKRRNKSYQRVSEKQTV